MGEGSARFRAASIKYWCKYLFRLIHTLDIHFRFPSDFSHFRRESKAKPASRIRLFNILHFEKKRRDKKIAQALLSQTCEYCHYGRHTPPETNQRASFLSHARGQPIRSYLSKPYASGKGPTQQTLFFWFLELELFVLLMLMLQNKITIIVVSTTHVNSVKNNVLYSEL